MLVRGTFDKPPGGKWFVQDIGWPECAVKTGGVAGAAGHTLAVPRLAGKSVAELDA